MQNVEYTKRSIKKKAKVEKKFAKAVGKTVKKGAKLATTGGGKKLSKANAEASKQTSKLRKGGEVVGMNNSKLYKKEARAGISEKVGKDMMARPEEYVTKRSTANLKVKRTTPLHGTGGTKSLTLKGKVRTKKK